MLETLLKDIYPPDFLVNLATRSMDRFAPDRRWTYVKNTNAYNDRYVVICGCDRYINIGPMVSDAEVTPSTYKTITMYRHFHIQQKVYFLGRCNKCNQVFWASPELKKIGEEAE